MKKGVRSDLRLHCFPHPSINRRNSLTQEEVDAPSVNSFKNHLETLEDGLLHGLTWSPTYLTYKVLWLHDIGTELDIVIHRGRMMTRSLQPHLVSTW